MSRATTSDVLEHSPAAQDPHLTRSYTFDALVAVGGMGHIFAGRRRNDQRRVAIKVFQCDGLSTARLREYMLHEVYALTVGANPLLVELLEFGETPGGTPYVVLEWLEGPNLADVLSIESPVATPRAYHLFGRLLDALELLHGRNVIHGDLKPDNLMLVRAPDGREILHLIDLGAASAGTGRVCLPHEVLGTPGYIAPEVIEGEVVSVQSDVYGAGVILFELLTGSTPSDGVTMVEALGRHSSDRPRRPVDHRPSGLIVLDRVIATALASDPRRRFRDIAQLRGAFVAAIDPSACAPMQSSSERPTSPYRRPAEHVR